MSATQSHTQIAQGYVPSIDPSQQARSMNGHHSEVHRQPAPRPGPVPAHMLASLGPSPQFGSQPQTVGVQQLHQHVALPGSMVTNPSVQMSAFMGNAAPQGVGMNNQAAQAAGNPQQYRIATQRTPQQQAGQHVVMGAHFNGMMNGNGLGGPTLVGPSGIGMNPQGMHAGIPNGAMPQPMGGVRQMTSQPMGMNPRMSIPNGMMPMASAGVPPGSVAGTNQATALMQRQLHQHQALAAAARQDIRLTAQVGPSQNTMQMNPRPGMPPSGIVRTTSAQPMLGGPSGPQHLSGVPLTNSAQNGFPPSAMMQPQPIQQSGFNPAAMQNRPPGMPVAAQISHPASAPPLHTGQSLRATPDNAAGNMYMGFSAERMPGIEQTHMNVPPSSSSPPVQQQQHTGEMPLQMVGIHTSMPGRPGFPVMHLQQPDQHRPGSSSGHQQPGQPPQLQQSPRTAPNVFTLPSQIPPNGPSRPPSQNVMHTPRTPHTPIGAPPQAVSHHASPRTTPTASPAAFPPRPTSQPTMVGVPVRPPSQPRLPPGGHPMHNGIPGAHQRVEAPIQRAPSASAQYPGQGTALTATGQISQVIQGGPFPTPGAPGGGPQPPPRQPTAPLGQHATQPSIGQRNKAGGETQPGGVQGAPVRPPSVGATQRAGVPGLNGAPPGQMQPPQPGTAGPPVLRPNLVPTPAPFGHAYQKLLQFGGQLADEDNVDKLSPTYWKNLVETYFTSSSITKLTLWRDQGNEAKPFEISVPILARYFFVTHQSGVRSMRWSLDGGQETPHPHDASRLVFNCNSAIWTHRYTNGYTIALRGQLQATICLVANTPNVQPPYLWKIDSLLFDATSHEKFLSTGAILGHRTMEQSKGPRVPPLMNGPSSLDERSDDQPRMIIDKAFIPSEPVNAFGIPQATMRCLELAESVAQMAPLIQYSYDHKLGPLESLKQYTRELRESMGAMPPHSVGGFAPGPSFPNVPGPSQPSQQAPVPPSIPPDSPTKTNRPGPPGAQPPTSTSTTPAPLARASSSTPTLTSASLKRKADGTVAASTSEPQPKRNQRKRGGTTSKS